MTNVLKRTLTLANLPPISFLSFLPWLALIAWFSSVAWFLCDDAFISFRYVRNLLEGHGLVFNPGERVEGYTNFLWILELAAIWGIFGVRPEYAAPWLSVAYTFGTIVAIVWWLVRLPFLQHRMLVGWMALGLLCSSATFAVWTSGGGLETRQFTFFIVAAVVCLSVHGNSRRGLLAASLILAAAELTRPEGLLLAACCFAWFAAQRILAAGSDISISRFAREMTFLVAPFVVLVAVHFLFRYVYYGEWLPNTYYAKHVRPWYESGFRYLWSAALETGLYLLLPLAFLALRTRWRICRNGSYALPLLCVASHMAYLLPIGGDYFEYRPLDFYWPLLALPAAEGISYVGSRVAAGLRALPQGRGSKVRWETYTIALFVLVLFYANAMQGALLFEKAAIREYVPRLHIELNEENAGWLLAAPGMPVLVAISNDLRRLSVQHKVGSTLAEHRALAIMQMQRWMQYEQLERDLIPDDALMADGGIGKFYYIPHLRVIDTDGLTDATIARNPVTVSNLERVLAHDRRPPPGYFKQRGVNFMLHIPTSSADAALANADYALKFGPDLWMPFDAVEAQWATARFAGRDLRARKTFSTTEPAGNQFHIGERTFVGERFLGHFEHGFDGWQLSGEAVTNYSQHERSDEQELIWGRADSDFLTSYHPGKGNRVTGKARSPAFIATADQYLAFLIAGGGGKGVGLRLLADGAEVAVWRGANIARFDLEVYPLALVAGKSLQLELFDNELGDWGHIMLDHVMLVACETCVVDERMVLAHALAQQPHGDDTVYLVPGFADSLDYMYQRVEAVYAIPINAPDLVKKVESTLAALEDISIVRVVEWNTVNRWIDDNIDPLAFLLAKYGRYQGSDQFDDLQIHNYTDIVLTSPWAFYEQLEPLTVNYDGGIALRGVALGQVAEQLSLQQPLNLGSSHSLWGVLRWQTDPGIDIDYAISLRLYDYEGELVFQVDDVLRNPTNHRPTSDWPANEPVDTLFQLEFPADLPSGYYELRLLVYNFETEAPAVELDVWEPEKTLARLQLAQAE